MILGIGTDLIDIRRIQRTLDRFGERFTARCFTTTETTGESLANIFLARAIIILLMIAADGDKNELHA